MKLEKLILGAFASFVEEGTAVDANTVGVDFYPDTTTDADEWNSIGCVLDSRLEPVTETDTDDCPSPSGGYVREETVTVRQDILKLSLKEHSEPIWRMIFGLSAKIQDGVAATPFANKERHVKGWLHFQLRAEDGEDRAVLAIYGKMRLDANPVWSKDPTKPAIRFEILDSSIASLLPDDIVA